MIRATDKMFASQCASFGPDSTTNDLSLQVMITTHNRLDDLKRTLHHVTNMSPPADGICVTCDGCTDGTAEWLRTAHPEVQVIVNQPGKGSVASRDHMIRESRSDLILSLDDDSYPIERDAIRRLKVWMQDHPMIAVTGFPQRSEEFPESLTEPVLPDLGYCATYANSGACYRRSVYEKVQGFYLDFFHAYEEPDYALQCISAGMGVYHTSIISIRHHYSPVARNEMRTHHRHARNELWSTLMRAPLALVPAIGGYRLVSQLRFASRYGIAWVMREPIWWYHGLFGAVQCLRDRHPVSLHGYRMWLSLLRRPTREQAVWDNYLSRITR